MKKLIRDHYIDVIDRQYLHKATNDEAMYYLYMKLHEEIAELASSDFKDPEEYADVLEVVDAIALHNNIHFMDIAVAKENKLLNKGGFKSNLILTKD